MKKWTRVSGNRSVRRDGCNQREDVHQEAYVALMEIWNKYSATHCLDELQKMGRRAIFYHTASVHARHMRDMVGSRKCAPIGVDVESYISPDHAEGRMRVKDILVANNIPTPGRHRDICHDRLVVRDMVSRIAAKSDEARTVLVSLLDLGDRLPGEQRDTDVFNWVRKEVRAVLHEGYTRRGTYNTKGDKMNETGTMSPDETGTTPAQEKAAEKPAKPAAKPRVPKVQKAASGGKKEAEKAQELGLSMAEKDRVSKSFKKGQPVVYVGGAKAKWLKPGTQMTVEATPVSRAHTYVRSEEHTS